MYVQNKYVFRLNCMPMYESVSNKAITLYVTRWATAKTWNSLRFSLLKTKNRHNNVIKTHIKQFRCLIFESPSTDTYTPFIFSGWILHHLSIDFRCVFFCSLFFQSYRMEWQKAKRDRKLIRQKLWSLIWKCVRGTTNWNVIKINLNSNFSHGQSQIEWHLHA